MDELTIDIHNNYNNKYKVKSYLLLDVNYDYMFRLSLDIIKSSTSAQT
jgi:hypothetical protein